MPATDFDSFRMGVDLTSANYTGGAGGTFGDLVQGADFWTVNGATPTFETRAGREGMLFTNSAAQAVIAPMLALHEATVVCIAQGATGTQPAIFGGTDSGNTWWALLASTNLLTRSPPATQASVAGGAAVTSAPAVMVCGWYPKGGTLYAQVNGLAPGVSIGNGKDARINWHQMAIGRHRTSYFSGWIARVLVFDRYLPARDPDGVEALIAEEMALVGL